MMNYLIYGNSYNLIDAEIKKIIGHETYRNISLLDINLKDFIEDISYNSMFEEKKIIVLKNFETIFQSKKDNSDNLEMLINYLKNPDDNIIVIFISSEKINEKNKINKELLSRLNIIQTAIISKSYELAKTFGEVIKKDGYKISQNTLNNFCEKCASNYDIAVMEFNKLKIVKKENRVITDFDIEEYVSNYNMMDSFGLKDAIINKDIKKALRLIEDIESSKMEIVPIVVMLAKEYQLIYNIKKLAQKKLMNDEIGSKLGNMHQFRVKLLRDVGGKYSEDELIHIIKYLCNLDLKLVSQDNLGYDEMRKFLLEL